MNRKIVIGLIIAFLMVSSIFGFVLDFAAGPGGKLKYNGFKFQPVNNQFIAKVNGQEHRFLFFPGDIEYIQISPDVKALLEKPVLTVTYDPASSISENFAEVQYYFEVQLGEAKIIERALTNNTGTELVQKSCSDATDAQPVIFLSQSSSSGITAEGNCIKLSALDPYDLYQQSERIVYSILGVIND